MILIDANLLIYAANESMPQHGDALSWLEKRLSSPEPVGFAWHPIVAFLRISTNTRLFDRPLTTEEAVEVVQSWLDQPQVMVLEPSPHHWEIFAELLNAGSVRGPLTTDAHLAALAIGNGATLYTTDSDFTRFPGLRVVNPLRDTTPR